MARPKATRLWVGVFVLTALLLTFAALKYSGKRGRVETVEYDSVAVGGKRRLLVYLPPDYSQAARYPVLYLLHGAGDDETSWQEQGTAGAILDRLYGAKQVVSMIVVMPSAQGRGSAFEQDLLDEVVPYIDSHYPTRTDGKSRAIAGLSMGGGQALKIGLKHPDRFAWVGSFSPSLAGPLESEAMSQLEQPATGSRQRQLLWLSCGDTDHLKGLVEALHRHMEAN